MDNQVSYLSENNLRRLGEVIHIVEHSEIPQCSEATGIAEVGSHSDRIVRSRGTDSIVENQALGSPDFGYTLETRRLRDLFYRSTRDTNLSYYFKYVVLRELIFNVNRR